VTFKGIANASAGSLSTDIASIGYKVGSAQWEQVATSPLHNVAWSVPIVLVAGLNTVQFNTTDNEATPVTTVSPSYTVLVDTAAPTFTTPTVANSSSTATLTITSAGGDLNASSVTAWANGTAIAASNIVVTGTNKPGSSENYSVSINNLPLGTWSLEVFARTLAGTGASTTATVTVTTTHASNAYTFTTPSSCTLGTYNAVCVPVTNTQAAALTGIVFAVVHNAAGQTVAVATSTVPSLAGGASATAYVVLSVPAGTYSVNVFVWSTTGNAISAPQTVSITVA